MKINLAKVVPFLGVVLVFVIWAVSQSTSTSSDAVDTDAGYGYGYDGTPFGTTSADAYLDQLAVRLAQPGLYVDPAVYPTGRLSQATAARLDQMAAETDGPVRVAVVPYDAVAEDDPTDEADQYYYHRNLAYAEDELVAQLYDRVGVDGTYAILVDADSSYDGRSFTAFQFAEEKPFYDVEGALDQAINCCAPSYDRILTTFLEHAGDEKTNPWPIVGWVAAGIAALLALLFGGTRLRRWRTTKKDDAQVADALRPSLQEEVVELSGTVASLPPPVAAATSATSADGVPGQDDVATRTRRVLDLVEEARHRLDVTEGHDRMDTPDEVEQVVSRLSDARWELVAIAALREGKPVPQRTAPCFFDPRHGPSIGERKYTPDLGAEREVPVCARCAEQIDAGQRPEVRTLSVGGIVKPYWQWDRYSRPYVNGYWQRYGFADQAMQRQRFAPAVPVSRPRSSGGGGMQFVWESDSGSGSSSGGSSRGSSVGSRRFAGSSGRRSSFGGGSSSRSHTRSGGSRRF